MTKFTYNGKDDDDEIDKIINEHKAKIRARGPIVDQMEKADAEAYANSQAKKDLDEVKKRIAERSEGESSEQIKVRESELMQDLANRTGKPKTLILNSKTNEKIIFSPQSKLDHTSTEDEVYKTISEYRTQVLARGSIVEQMDKYFAESYANSQLKKNFDEVKMELALKDEGKTDEQLQQEEYDYYQKEANNLGEPQTVICNAETNEKIIFYPQSNPDHISAEDEVDKTINEYRAKIRARGPIVDQMEKADAEAYANSDEKKQLDSIKNRLAEKRRGKTREQLRQEEYDLCQQWVNKTGKPQTLVLSPRTGDKIIFYPQGNPESISPECQKELDEDIAWIFEKPKPKE